MTTENTKALAIIPRSLDDVHKLTAQFAKSVLLPPELKGKEADIFVTMLAGQELGLPPMAALRGIHVVKGKPILSADTMVAVVLGSGLAEHFTCIAESDTSVTYETKRRGSPNPVRTTWTIKDAERARLDGDNWKKFPRAMLKARCKAVLARDVYPDVLAGCYEEAEAADAGLHSTTVAFAPIPGADKAIDVAAVEQSKPAPAAASAPAPETSAPAASSAPPAKPAEPAKPAGPPMTDEHMEATLTAIGQAASRQTIREIAAQRIAPFTKTPEQHARLVKAVEEQLDMIEADAQANGSAS